MILLTQKITFSLRGKRNFLAFLLSLCLNSPKKDPGKIGYPIQYRKIDVLVFMVLLQLLPMMYPHKLDFDIVVFSLNIGVGMMGDVVLQFSEIDVAS